MDTKNLLSIGEVSKLFDIHIKSLRYYEKIGVFKPYYVDPNNQYRYYTYQQLSILEAIKTCIELEIPLKKFKDFTEDNGNVVNFAELVAFGKRKALEKINLINRSLSNIENIQTEIEQDMLVPTNGQKIIVSFPKSYYFIKPFEEEPSRETYYEDFSNLFREAMASGYQTGLEIGKLYIYQAASVKKYNFIQIIEPADSKSILTLPTGERIIKCVADSRIEYAPEEFPEVFSEDHDKIILESELFSSTFNLERPLLKLSCMKG